MGVHVEDEAVRIDFAEVMERMRRIRAEISYDDSVHRFTREGVEIFLGAARFTGQNTIEVDDGNGKTTLTFKKAVICTGSNPRELPIPGLHEAGFLTNETLFQLTEQPKRMAILGSGPIGSEMAQTFARLGTQVTILERMGQILTKEDPDAAKVVQEAMRRDGVDLCFGVEVKRVEVTPTGKRLSFTQDGAEQSIEVDAILVSAGRVPGVDGLNLEAAGIEYNERAVVTDETLQTTNPHVYASGDVAQKYQFTHMADATSRLVLRNALFPGPKQKLSSLVVPWCTYTDPQIAHVGLNEKSAQEQGVAIDTFVKHFDEVDRARTDGETEGFVKIHIKQGTDKIVGATIVASEAGEMISEITTAMVGGIGLKTLATVIHPYPVQAEAIKKIADMYNRTRLTPLVKRAFQAWMRLTR
jgi:pyruvate/2-oxoglutarate dehydrogenase complex dihydrolipoamide dehydrogenase (E3) component